MKKLVYISFFFALIVAFASCEREVVTLDDAQDPFAREYNSGCDGNCGTKSSTTTDPNQSGDTITDPDEDEDYDSDDDNIVDPDEDEDYDSDGK